MLFTIVTATYNSERTLKRTIESLLNQAISNFEYIIIDGKSTDNTVDIIKSYENHFRRKKINYKWISEKDNGIYDAFNKGIKLAEGEWISFLGSDDYYLKDSLKAYKNEIEKYNKEFDLVHSIVKLEDKKIIEDKWNWKKFRRAMNIAHVGAFHHKNYFDKYGLFDTTYKIAGDYELLLRAKNKLKTLYFKKITAIMADGGISNSQIKNVFRETTNAKKISGGLPSFICELDYMKWIFKYKVKSILSAFNR